MNKRHAGKDIGGHVAAFRWCVSACLAGVIGLLLAAPAEARRVALVVGIADYAHSPRLANAVNDAKAVSESLGRIGFEVETAIDADIGRLTTALETFYAKAQGSEAALFYYSGHAVQVKGTNFIVAKDAELKSEVRLLRETVPLQAIVRAMEERAGITLAFLDACRDNPLAEQLQRSILGKDRSAAVPRGLARMDFETSNTLVVFSAKAGRTASDGTGANSPFTAAMLRHMETPGEDIEVVMKRVSRDVQDLTGGQQVPERLADLTTEFSLNPVHVEGWGTVVLPPMPVIARSEGGDSGLPSAEACKGANQLVRCIWRRP